MMALNEKVRTVVLFRPQLLIDGKADEIVAKLGESYLEVKAQKQVYLTAGDVENLCRGVAAEERASCEEAWTRGLSRVLVLEHLDNDAIERAQRAVEGLVEQYGDRSIYCSGSRWESMRDMEFFFPHLDHTPVERTLALVKPDGVAKGGLVDGLEAALHEAGLLVVGRHSAVLSEEQATLLCTDLKGTDGFKAAVANLVAEAGTVGLCVEGPGAVGKLQLLCGPSDPALCREYAPTALRARWGESRDQNAVHASMDLASAERELRAVFPVEALQLQRTLCIVKPHAMGSILQIRMAIEDAGFTILKEKHTEIGVERAREFYASQKQEPDYEALVQAASAGKSALLVLCRLEAVQVLQQLLGPDSVADAQDMRPKSLRARFGAADDTCNGVHGSATARGAGWEVRFFFPELGSDPVPSGDEVRDFIFRKAARQSMDLKTLSPKDSAADYTMDPTLQQLISSGLLSLCQVRPKGLQALTWFKEWLTTNNPNTQEQPPEQNRRPFQPAERTKRFVEQGVTEDGLPFSVEAPPAPPAKQIIEVDVAQEATARSGDFKTPPHVVFVLGAAGAAPCVRLAEDMGFVLLDAGALLKAEVDASTRLGTDAQLATNKGQEVPDEITLELLKKAMLNSSGKNRFLIEGFPKTAAQAKMFETQVAPIAFVLSLNMGAETPPEAAEVVSLYSPVGRVRSVDTAKEDAEAVYADVKAFFRCRLVYLMGPPGMPLPKVAARLEQKYGYHSIDVNSLLQNFAKTAGQDADAVRHSLAKGKAVEASLLCPLVLTEVNRGRALGATSFVICDFPQSLKQAEFLEYEVPCVAKPLLLDFSRADAEDLASLPSAGAGAMMRTDVFFSEERQAMIRALPGLTAVPCSLAEAERSATGRGPSTPEALEAQIEDAVWRPVCERLRPRLVLALGLPGSGTGILAPLLARASPNTYAVDCEKLLAQADAAAAPLPTALEMIKGVASLTCSDCVVVQNCPVGVDDLAHLEQEFTIERACYIEGDEKSVAAWRTEFLSQNKQDEDRHRTWDEREKSLRGVVTRLGRLGRLDRLPVLATPQEETLAGLLSAAGMPSFILVAGLSTVLTPKVAELLASELKVAAPLHLPRGESPAETIAKLTEHAEASSAPIVVLDRCAQSEEEAAEFVAAFGVPQLIVNVNAPEDFIEEEFKAANENMEEDAAKEKIDEGRAAFEGAVKAFQESCSAAVVSIDVATLKSFANVAEEPVKVAEEVSSMARAKLVPKAYVVVAPAGPMGDFGSAVAETVCMTARKGPTPSKFTVVDLAELFRAGGHSTESENALSRASFTAAAQDCLPSDLWVRLVREAFASAANPMGPFLVTGFPTASAVSGGPSIRDQFCMLESVANLGGILQVRVSDEVYAKGCSAAPAAFEEYSLFASVVEDQISKQYDKSRICECLLNRPSEGLAGAAKASEAFLEFLERPAE